MAKTEQPLFINVGGEYYMLETAASEFSEENLKQKAKELEAYFSHKGNGPKETVPAKEPKATEKSLTLDSTPDKEAAENVADKWSSPPKEFYKGKESKKNLKDFQLKSETPKAYEENVPYKAPSKIQVKGFIYERVDEPQTPPDKIRVNGQVYERIEQPERIRVGGKTFIKLSDDEAREVLAKKGGKWNKEKAKAFMKGIAGKGTKHKVTKCIREIEKHNENVKSGKSDGPKITDPGALCGSAMQAIKKDEEKEKAKAKKTKK